ncbi:MAG: hypothetical protein PT944_07440 [Actinomycetaceae bacterium]|nr:hypothetical protein [Arcanobacterium sp.]MDD7687719.1 hypothetical protein [Actinomycetaceae bacterium]MDY5274242.1 hypothetical protein [Arcanobacterium sp.]
MSRELTASERDLVAAMLMYAAVSDGDTVTQEERERWLSGIDGLRVTGICGCGLCPTINFNEHYEPETRLWLEAYDAKQDAGIILFIDDGELSCLEVYPTEDKAVSLPAVENVDFT